MTKYNFKSGQIFGKVMLTGKSYRCNRNRYVEYICECGKIGWARLAHLRDNKIKSCGCYNISASILRATTHGLNKHPLYSVWTGMKQRCYDVNLDTYHLYGGRGVTVCDEWVNDFKAFYEWAIAHGYKKGLQLDKDKLSPNQVGIIYSPQYCSFLTSKENCRNTTQNRIIEYNGEKKNLSAWCEEFDLNYHTVHGRLRLGKSLEYSFAKPTKKGYTVLI